MKKNILKLIENDNAVAQIQELKAYLQTAQNEVSVMMSMGAFPRFRKSNLFKEYLKQTRNEKELELALQIMAQEEVKQPTVDDWLSSFYAATQNLPIGVSLASTERGANGVGFPLLFVNTFFETTTGYTNAEMVGKNCRLLQAGRAEKESIDRLSAALRVAAPVKVVITNARKDGSPFRNLLALQPITDEGGAYRYVVGVQFDVTQADATPAKLQLVDELMKMLTRRIPSKTPAKKV